MGQGPPVNPPIPDPDPRVPGPGPGGGPPQHVWSLRDLGKMREWYKGQARPLDKAWTVSQIRRDEVAQRLLNEGMLSTAVSAAGDVVTYATDRMRSLMWRQFQIPAE